ncbi:hypothetical protein J5I95_13850 [Candidatus Poribacteria bacterium]|nr:hypothetical protein [Candidatus Poribacteria bacterium]
METGRGDASRTPHTMVQQCRYCGDFYRIDDEDMAVENDDGWVSDICCQCQTALRGEDNSLQPEGYRDTALSIESNSEAQAFDEAWQHDCQQLNEDV